MWTSHALAIALLVLVLVAWLAIQRAWRASVGDGCSDPDALAGRLGCRAPSCPDPCGARLEPGRASSEEEVS